MSEDARETAGVTTRLIVAYVRDALGDPAVERLLDQAGESRSVAVLEDDSTWSTYVQKIALFEAAAQLTGDPDVAHRIGEGVLSGQLAGFQRRAISALGSPQRVLRGVAEANAKFSTSATMRAVEVEKGRALVTYRLHEGHVPSRHDCLYTQGVLSQAPALFGLPSAKVNHPVCQVRGATECRYEVRWQHRRWRREEPDSSGLQALRERMADLERTVTELVSPQEVDEILRSLGARAGTAVAAQRHLLAVRVADGRAPHIHGVGLSEQEAEAIGVRLLDHDPALPEPPALLGGHVHVVAKVASARRHYGWIAAYLPADTGFLPGEQEHLEAYAKLAAAALDVSTALEEARNKGAMSQALLRLGRQLAVQTEEQAIAQHVVEAVPAVVGADRSSLYLWDEPTQRMRSVAVHQYGDFTAAALQMEITLDATPQLEMMRTDPQPRVFDEDSDDPWIAQVLRRLGHRAIVTAPVLMRGELIGLVMAGWSTSPPQEASLELVSRGLLSLADQTGLAIANQRLLEQTRHLATHDQLTGLARPGLFNDRVGQTLADMRRAGGMAAVFFIDLDRFKHVNDTSGHQVGDALLEQVAGRIRQTVRESDGVARLGGDEFAILLRHLADNDAAERVASDLVTALGRPYEVAGERLSIGASIGVAFAPRDGATATDLLQAADAAMYRAKNQGGCYRVFDDGEAG